MPYVEQRGNKFRVKWWAGEYLPSGEKKFETQSGFTTWDDANEYGLDQESDLRNHRYLNPRDGSVLMKDFIPGWLDDLSVGHLRETAIRSMTRLYIKPRWGEFSIGDIKPSMYRAWDKWLGEQPNIGDKYALEIKGVFSMMMDDAVEDGMRASSPVQRRTRRGRFVKRKREEKEEAHIEEVFQVALNALTFWGLPGFVFYLSFVFCQSRPAELYALRREFTYPNWPAADPDPSRRRKCLARYAGPDPMPAIRTQYQHQWKGGALALLPPKYESHRTQVVPPFLAELLALLLDSHDNEWTFPAIKGGPVRKANPAYHYWRPVVDGRKATPVVKGRGRGGHWRPLPEIPAVEVFRGRRSYLLRHVGKTWLDEDGHSRIAVETRMGHELAGVEGLYTMVTVAMERAIMDSLQLRWTVFLASFEDGWEDRFPTSCPVDLMDWMKVQVKAAKGLHS